MKNVKIQIYDNTVRVINESDKILSAYYSINAAIDFCNRNKFKVQNKTLFREIYLKRFKY